jgi:hypothetical protein
MHYAFRALAVAAVFVLSAPFASAGELTLTIANGRATVVATDVPLRQILAEWGRVGQTKIVNGDKLAGPNLTLQIVDRPEREVLDILLRTAAGYVMAPREVALANASEYDRIMILPTSRAPAASASASVPTFNRPAAPMPVPDHDDEPMDAPMPPGMGPQPPPGANMMPPPLPGHPGQQNAQPGTNQGQLTAPRPGIVTGPPQQQGVPNPYQPPPVVRPPGGGRGGGGGQH